MGNFEDVFGVEVLTDQADNWAVFGGDTVDANNIVNTKSIYDSRQGKMVNFSGGDSSDNIKSKLDRDIGDTTNIGVWKDAANTFKKSLTEIGGRLLGARASRKEFEAAGIRPGGPTEPMAQLIAGLFGIEKEAFDVATDFGAKVESDFYRKASEQVLKKAEGIEVSSESIEGDIIHNPSFRKIITGVAGTSASAASAITLGLIAGPEVTGVAFGEIEAESLLSELDDVNIPLKDKALLMDVVSPVVGAIEFANIDFFLGKGADKFAKKAVTKGIYKGLAEVGIISAANIAEEVAQKGASEMAWNKIVAQAGYAKAKKFSDGLGDTIILAGLTGGLMGGGKIGISALNESTLSTDRARADLENAGVDPELIDIAMAETAEALNENKVEIANGFDSVLGNLEQRVMQEAVGPDAIELDSQIDIENELTPESQQVVQPTIEEVSIYDKKTVSEGIPTTQDVVAPVDININEIIDSTETIEDQLKRVRKYKQDETFKDRVIKDSKDIRKSAGILFSDKIENMSSRIRDISPKLEAKAVINESKIKQDIKRYEDISVPLIEKYYALDKGDRAELGYLLNSNKMGDAMKLAERKGLGGELRNVIKLLDQLSEERRTAGIREAKRTNYFPRRVSDFEGFQKSLGTENNQLQEALDNAAKEKGSALTLEEKNEIVGQLFNGKSVAGVRLIDPKSAKERRVDIFSPEINQYYDDPMQALISYIYDTADAVGQRRLFGKGELSLEDSMTRFLVDLVESGEVTQSQAEELQDILGARFNPVPAGKLVQGFINLGYATTLADGLSALTQFGDLGNSIYLAGWGNTGKSIASVLSKNEFRVTLEDLGINEIAEEFRRGSMTGETTRKLLEPVFKKSDALNKEIVINAVYKKLQQRAKTGDAALLEELELYFDDGANDVMEALRNGKFNSDISSLLFARISQVQPISPLETTSGYQRGGNAKMFYQMKTFQLRQFNFLRDISFKKISKGIETGNKELVKEGIRNGVSYWALMMLLGAGIDDIKDVVRGKKIEWIDNLLDNSLRPLLLSSFDLKIARRKGVGDMLANKIMPVTGFIDNSSRDFLDFAENSIRRLQGKRPKKRPIRTIKNVPFVGRTLYSRLYE